MTWFAFGNADPQSKLGYAQSVQFTVDGRTQTVWFGDSPVAVSPDGKFLVELGYPRIASTFGTQGGTKDPDFVGPQDGR